MKLETILNAMAKTILATADPLLTDNWIKRNRQRKAFRTRILKMDTEKDEIIGILKRGEDDYCNSIRQRDARIAELEMNVIELLEISTKEGLARLEEDDD